MDGPVAEPVQIKTKRRMKRPELLAPAGNLEKLKFAVLYGADAVYIGGQQFGLRAKAGNFSFGEMEEGVRFAHSRGVKVYVAANIIAHHEDFGGLEEYLKRLQTIGIDAVIVADPAIIEACKAAAPGLEIHLSTQASTTNWQAIRFWHEEGVSRVVLAREVTMEEIREIKAHTDVEIEAFIHGAMCMSYSGRCVLSNYMTNRDANRGGCAQSCRWYYDLYVDEGEEARPLYQSDGEAFTMGSKDLMLVEQIPQLIDAGVESLKIEGRMKSIHYVATVVSVYRKVIDAYMEDPTHFIFQEAWRKELLKAAGRPVTTAFFDREAPTYEDQIYGQPPKMLSFDFAGLVLGYDPEEQTALIEQRNHFAVGDEVEFFGPGRENFTQLVEEIWDEEGERIDVARHAQQKVRMKVKRPLAPFDMMRKEKRS